jgi:hypothetical protein
MFTGCPLDLLWMFPECSLDVPWMFPECSLQCEREFHIGCLKEATGVSLTECVAWMFPGCSLDVSWMFPGCSLNVPWMFPTVRARVSHRVSEGGYGRLSHWIRCLNVPWIFAGCFLDVPWMFPECSLNVPWMFPECSLQCEREFHIGCLKEATGVSLTAVPEGSWFCSDQCKRINQVTCTNPSFLIQ